MFLNKDTSDPLDDLKEFIEEGWKALLSYMAKHAAFLEFCKNRDERLT